MILNFPTDRVCNCRTDVSGLCNLFVSVCNRCTRPPTHTHTQAHVCVYIYKLVTQWGLFPCSLCGRSRLQLPNLVLSLFWGLLDQFLIFSLFWKEWCFLKLGLELGGRDRGMTKTTTFLVLDFKKIYSQTWAVTTRANCGQALHCWR